MTPKAAQPLEERIAKALSHPLRQRILAHLNDHGVASPNAISIALGERIGNVSYHMRILREYECVELVRTEPRRGAVEHFYRAMVRPFFDDAQWAKLPVGVRRQLFGENLRHIWTDVSAAAGGEGFDHPKAHVSRTPIELDAEAFETLTGALEEVLDLALRLHAETAGRIAGGQESESHRVELAMLLFHRERPPGLKATKKPASGGRRATESASRT